MQRQSSFVIQEESLHNRTLVVSPTDPLQKDNGRGPIGQDPFERKARLQVLNLCELVLLMSGLIHMIRKCRI